MLSNTFESVIQSTITTCDGQPLCLEEVNVGGEVFIGVGTKCEQRFRWENRLYQTVTEEDYAGAVNGTVKHETQRWVIRSKSGCLKQLRGFYPFNQDPPIGSDRLAVDPACAAENDYDYQFYAIMSPFHSNETLSENELSHPFSLVEAHENHTRRGSYYVNQTDPYTREDGQQCACVPDTETDDLSRLLRMQTHLHLRHQEPERSYFYVRALVL